MNNTTSQNFTASGPVNPVQPIRVPLYSSYIAFGPPAVITNLAIIVILLSDKKLLGKWAMIAGLAVGNLFNGLHAFGYGVYRVPLLISNQIDLPASNWACMASLMPTCLLLGYAVPACMQVVIGIERLLAIAAFNWYRQHWPPRKSWYVVGAIYALNICCWVIPEWYQNLSQYRLVTKECSSKVVIRVVDNNTLFCFTVVTGLLGMTLIFVAVILGRRRFPKISPGRSGADEVAQYKRQLRFSKMMLIIALFEFIFVVLPNLTIALASVLNYSAFMGLFATQIYCINSTASIFVYLLMNSAFRRVATSRVKALMKAMCK